MVSHKNSHITHVWAETNRANFIIFSCYYLQGPGNNRKWNNLKSINGLKLTAFKRLFIHIVCLCVVLDGSSSRHKCYRCPFFRPINWQCQDQLFPVHLSFQLDLSVWQACELQIGMYTYTIIMGDYVMFGSESICINCFWKYVRYQCEDSVSCDREREREHELSLVGVR